MYRETPIGILDEYWKPVTPNDSDYLDWLAAGNTPERNGFPTLDELKTRAIAEINRQAAEQRARYRTPNMAETYAQKQRDIDKFVNSNGNITVDDVPYAARRAARKNGISKNELAKVTRPMLITVIDEFRAAMTTLRIYDLDIEDVREAAIEQVKTAPTEANVTVIMSGLNWTT